MTGRDYWDKIAHQYDNLYNNPWSEFEDAQTATILTRELHLAGGSHVLDIGCGNGLGYRLLQGETIQLDYTGIDISREMLSQLQRRHPEAQTILGSADQALQTIADESVDFAFAINTAASFPPNTDIVMRHISRILRRSGRFSLSFLNQHSLRRYISGKSDVIEVYKTRGDNIVDGGVNAITMNESEFVRLSQPSMLASDTIEYQSVLGGVWESRWALV